MERGQFYICKHCGNVVTKAYDSGVPIYCCGEEMSLIVPNTTDAAQEKHVPAVTVDGNSVHVQVGSVAHPMDANHYIAWIYLVTEKGVASRILEPGDEPVADFVCATGDKPLAVYEYCTTHGLWKADI